jgi:hypothetical protein
MMRADIRQSPRTELSFRDAGPVAPVESEVRQVRYGGKRVDVRPNWKERPGMPTQLRYG